MLQQFLNIEDEWVLSDSSLRLITSSFLDMKKVLQKKMKLWIVLFVNGTTYISQKISDWLNLFKCIYINKK